MPRSWDEIILACNLAPFRFIWCALVGIVLPMLFTCLSTNLPHPYPCQNIFRTFVCKSLGGKPSFQGKMILVLSGKKAFIFSENCRGGGYFAATLWCLQKELSSSAKNPPWNHNLDVWVNWLWNARRGYLFASSSAMESILFLSRSLWWWLFFFSREISPYTRNLICINLPPIKILSEMIKWKRIIIWFIHALFFASEKKLAWATNATHRGETRYTESYNVR